MPKFWLFLTQRWLGLPEHLSWSWWRALGKSPWSQCEDLRTSVLHYDRHPYPSQSPEAEQAAMQNRIAPGALIQTIDSLVRQRLLLKRDASMIENAILHRLDRDGEWR